jgi:hypothetical protein
MVILPGIACSDNVVATDSAILFGIDLPLRTTQGETAVFDLNQDGNLDIVGLSGHFDFRWPIFSFRNHRYKRDFSLPRATDFNLTDRHGCVAADFGSPAGSRLPDGLPDLYCVHGANEGKPDGRQWRNELYLQKQNHTFPISSSNDALDARVVACEWSVCDMHGRGREAVPLDFDRDGRMDIAVANDASVAGSDPAIGPWHGHDTPNRLFHNEGGSFREVTGTPVNLERASACVEAGDINGDGWVDLLFCAKPDFSGNDGRSGNDGKGVFTYINRRGEFEDFTRRTPYAAANPVQIELHDVDRDTNRRPDLVLIERDQMTIRLNRGGDNPFPVVDYRMPLTSGHDVALGDVNRDGMPDIYIVQSGQGSVNAPDVMLINGGSGKAFRELPLPNTTVGRGDAVTTIPKWNSTGRAAFLVTNGRLKHAGPVQLITFSAVP